MCAAADATGTRPVAGPALRATDGGPAQLPAMLRGAGPLRPAAPVLVVRYLGRLPGTLLVMLDAPHPAAGAAWPWHRLLSSLACTGGSRV